MQANYDNLVHDINNLLLRFNVIIAPQTIVSHFPCGIASALEKQISRLLVILATLWSIMDVGRKSRAIDLLTDGE